MRVRENGERGNGVIKLTDGNVAYGFMSRLEGEE